MILRALNVIPVDRGNKDSQLVEQMITEFKQRDSMYLCITPEGSRKKRKKMGRRVFGYCESGRCSGLFGPHRL